MVAVDNLFPSSPLLESLAALNRQFPSLPVTLYTEPIAAAERRLRAGTANIALCAPQPGHREDLMVEALTTIEMTLVAAASHPLCDQLLSACRAP